MKIFKQPLSMQCEGGVRLFNQWNGGSGRLWSGHSYYLHPKLSPEMAIRCRHLNGLQLYDVGLLLVADGAQDVGAWCPDCGALFYAPFGLSYRWEVPATIWMIAFSRERGRA